jgi:hypothetical protein
MEIVIASANPCRANFAPIGNACSEWLMLAHAQRGTGIMVFVEVLITSQREIYLPGTRGSITGKCTAALLFAKNHKLFLGMGGSSLKVHIR